MGVTYLGSSFVSRALLLTEATDFIRNVAFQCDASVLGAISDPSPMPAHNSNSATEQEPVFGLYPISRLREGGSQIFFFFLRFELNFIFLQ